MGANARGQFDNIGTGDLQVLCLEDSSCGRELSLHVMYARIDTRTRTSVDSGFRVVDGMYEVRAVHQCRDRVHSNRLDGHSGSIITDIRCPGSGRS